MYKPEVPVVLEVGSTACLQTVAELGALSHMLVKKSKNVND